jgi:hypothetical protein
MCLFVSDEILDDLVDEFGKGILSSSHPHTGLTLRQCQILLNEHGFEKGVKIIQEWKKTKEMGEENVKKNTF